MRVYLLSLFILSQICCGLSFAIKPKGAGFWKDFPKIDFVSVQATPNLTVNLTVDEFQLLANQNREKYNQIYALLKVNESRANQNILLFGPEGEMSNDDISTTAVPGTITEPATTQVPSTSNWTTFMDGEFLYSAIKSPFILYNINMVFHKVKNCCQKFRPPHPFLYFYVYFFFQNGALLFCSSVLGPEFWRPLL